MLKITSWLTTEAVEVKLLKLGLLAILFLLPFMGPINSFGYEQSKVIFFLFSTTILGFFWVWQSKKFHYPLMVWNLQSLLGLLFIIILGITSLLGVDYSTSFIGRYPYYQGLIVYSYLWIFSLMIASVKISLKEVSLGLTLAALGVSLLATKDYIVLYLFNIDIPTYAGRVVSSFGQPNFYAGFLLLSLPLVYFLALSKDEPLPAVNSGVLRTRTVRDKLFLKHSASANKELQHLAGLTLLFSGLAIVISWSRIAIILLILFLVTWLLLKLSILSRNILIFIIFIFMGAVFFSSIYFQTGIVWEELGRPERYDWFLHQFPERGFYFWQFSWTTQVEKRFYIWPVIGDLVLRKPLLGYGLDNLATVFLNSPLVNFNGIKNLAVDRAHSYFLDLLIFSGVGGLMLWISLAIFIFWKAQSKFIKASLFLYLIWSFFQNQSIAHLLFFWTLVGLSSRSIDR